MRHPVEEWDRLNRSGASFKDIAARYHTGESIVRKLVRQHRKTNPLTQDELSCIAKANGAKAATGGWTNERIELLKKLWAEGHSAGQIAKQMPGMSRNAVIGKVTRLGLPGRTTRVMLTISDRQDRQRAHRPGPVMPFPLPRPAVPKSPPPAGGKTLLDLEYGECRWPLGSPMDKAEKFCAAPILEGCSYCAVHAGVAYRLTPRQILERAA